MGHWGSLGIIGQLVQFFLIWLVTGGIVVTTFCLFAKAARGDHKP